MDIVEIPQNLGVVATALWTWALDFVPRVLAALVILVIGWIAAGWAGRAVKNLSQFSDRIDKTLHSVLAALVRYTILVLVVVAVLGQLGVATTSILAALGAAGLAIGLALQGTLSNIAAGMMLLWLRPFSVGDYIETPNVAGTIEDMGLFASQVRTWDGIYKFVPNSQLWNVTLTNYTRNPTRLVLLEFGISYEDDVAKARQVLIDTARSHGAVLKDPPPAVVPLSLADSAVVLQMRAWAPTATFWDIKWDLTQTGKRDLEAAGITIPYPQRVLHVSPSAAAEPGLVASAPVDPPGSRNGEKGRG